MDTQEIKKFLHGDIVEDKEMLDSRSRDYSIFKVEPQAVVFPKDVDDIKNLVAYAQRQKEAGQHISITARSAGTDMGGGPLNDSIILDFTKYFNHIKKIEDDRVEVEPGVYFRDLEKKLRERGLLYPPYPASKDLCAIGGIVSNNSGGEKSLLYGKTQNFVRELNVVLSDGNACTLKPLSRDELDKKMQEQSFEGEIYKKLFTLVEAHKETIQKAKPQVSKNSAGYDLWDVWNGDTFDITKVVVGSQGTLCMVTDATLGLVKEKKFHRLIVIFTKTLDPVPDLVEALLPYKPESIESYDDKTLELAIRFFKDFVALMGANIVKLAFSFLPEVGMLIRGGLRFPKMILLVEITSDDEKDLDSRTQDVKQAAQKFPVQVRVVQTDKEAEKYWTIRRQSFALLHRHSKDAYAAPFIDDVVVDPKYMAQFLPQLDAIVDQYKDKLTYTIAGHPGNGNFHIIPLMNLRDPSVRAIIPEISKKVYNLTLHYKGSITGEHNDGLIRTPYLEQMFGKEMIELFKEVKNIFDPHGIFNPHKKIDGDGSYAMEHMITDF